MSINKKKILVIDDDPDITESIQAILESNGFDAYTAASGAEGIESVAKVNPDLVLCDMMMEKIDSGSQVAAEIKKRNANLPVFLLSSIGDATATQIEVSKLGFNGVFQKPVSPDNLIDTVKKTLKMI